MRILVVGADSRYAIEKPYVRYLSANPAVEEVELFAAQNKFLVYYQRSLFNKIWYRLGFSRILTKINAQLKLKIESYSPDVLFVFKGMEVFASTLVWARGRSIKLANYNPDNPFVFSGSGSGNKHVTQSIGLYDLFMSYDRDTCYRMQREFNVRSELLPFGYDVPEDLFKLCARQKEELKACFVGNADEHRLSFLNGIAAAGVKLDLYGLHWHPRKLHPGIHYAGPVYEQELWKTLRRYRVQLNLMRVHNPHSHNMRSFEIPAIGGIQLAPATPDHAEYFEEGKEIFLYNDIPNCVSEIKKLLALSTAEANLVRTAARQRSLSSGYSYEDRARQVASWFRIMMRR